MTSSHNPTAVPTDVANVASFTENFRARFGLSPIAGGEANGAAPAATAPPPAPAAPAPAAAAPAPGGEPAATPPGPMSEATAQQLIERFDQLGQQGPPPPPDPFAVDLGFVAPAPAMPAQPQAQPGGIAPPGQPGMPMAPGMPQPGGAELPLGSPNERAAINQYVDNRAQAIAEARFEQLMAERVDPRFGNLDAERRRAEADNLVDQNPHLRDPKAAQELLATARNWSTQLSGTPDMAREPGFLELTLRAQRDIQREREAAAAAPVVPQPGGEVPIEGGGPAAPAGAVPDPNDLGARIVAASNRSRLSPTWT